MSARLPGRPARTPTWGRGPVAVARAAGSDAGAGRAGSVGAVLVAAALVPHTALLVPGAAGAADPLESVRVAAVAAARALMAASPDRLIVVAPKPRGAPRRWAGEPRPSLAAAGIDDDGLGWAGHRDPTGPRRGARGESTPGADATVGGSVALLLLRAAGWAGPVDVVTVATEDSGRLHDLGADLVAGPERVALVLAATLSARRGPDSPLPADPRAATVDDAVLADLSDLGATSVARLAAVPAELARELAISAWGPWQVLLGALRPGTSGSREAATCVVHHVSSGGSGSGVRYAALSWRWA